VTVLLFVYYSRLLTRSRRTSTLWNAGDYYDPLEAGVRHRLHVYQIRLSFRRKPLAKMFHKFAEL